MRGAKSVVNVKSFLKTEDGNPFYVLPVISEPLFPQFKGPKASAGVVRTGSRQGMFLSLLKSVVRRLTAFVQYIGRMSLDPGWYLSSLLNPHF